MADLQDLTSQCIRCGFCLESCPTFLLTGDESQSPRGRIYIARTNEGDWPQEHAQAIDSCLGCLACQTACPSGVRYGEILELARANSTQALNLPARKPVLDSLAYPPLARLQIGLGALVPGGKVPAFVSHRVSRQEPEASLPTPDESYEWPPFEAAGLPPVKGKVALLTGCLMGTLFPNVHEATRRLLRRVGFETVETGQLCCGALHAHNGHLHKADALATKLGKAVPDNLPLVINSAGCGSTVKSYGHVIGASADHLSPRTFDLTEFLMENGLEELLAASKGLYKVTATYHHACHLAHGQGVRDQPLALLSSVPGLRLVPLPEADMCCGSAGTYNAFQPQMARRLLDRKWDNVRATGCDIVVQGNPGCHSWLSQAAKERGNRPTVMHTAEVLEASFVGRIPH